MYKIGLKLKGFVCIDYILFPVRYMTCYPLQCYISMFVLIYRYLQLKTIRLHARIWENN